MKTETQVVKIEPEIVKPNVELSASQRFTNMVIKEFATNNGEIKLSEFQKKLCKNYFIKTDLALKEAEAKRLNQSENYREELAYKWENVNRNKLAIDVIAYSNVGLDPIQSNHINLIPYKNRATNKYDLGFIIGYKGMEIKAKKYGLDVPDSITVEIVRQKDVFKEIKKDANNPIEQYCFEIINSFDRGEIVGGFYYYQFKDTPEKNRIKTFTIDDIKKRAPKKASAEFWGGEKDEWKNGVKTGNKIKIEGWFDEMVYKTIYRAAHGAITIDSEKIDDNYLAIIEKERLYKDEEIKNEIEVNANKEELGFDEDAKETALKERSAYCDAITGNRQLEANTATPEAQPELPIEIQKVAVANEIVPTKTDKPKDKEIPF